MTVLLDTSVLIDVLNDRAGSREFLRELAKRNIPLASCAITVAEVYAGMRPKEARVTERLLATLNYFDTTPAIAKRGGELRAEWAKKGRTLGLPDTLIAAVALEYGLALATNNIKDFPMPELQLLPPLRPH